MGCDLSRALCERTQSRFGIPMHNGGIDSLEGGEQFAVVVMNHVLEHSDNPLAFLREVRRLLRPGGLVHIAVPNVASWEARLRGWTSYEPYHLAYLSTDTLRRALTQCSLSVELLATHDSFSGWFLTLLRTAMGVNRSEGAVVRQRGQIAGGEIRGTRAPLVEHAYRIATVLCGAATYPLRAFQAGLGRGDELVCIARRAS